MKVEKVTITPDMAEMLLERNTTNRKANSNHVNRLAAEMSSGNWKENGDTIVMNCDKLIDGQHRLQACVMSGVPFKTILVSDVNDDVFDTKDIGKRRSASDTLHVLGEGDTKNLGAIVRLVALYELGALASNQSVTNHDIVETLSRHPEIRSSLRYIRSMRKTLMMQTSIAGFCHYIFSRKDRRVADMFFDSLANGHGLFPNDPVLMLRQRIIQNSMAKAKLGKVEIIALVIKAWNAHREGKKVYSLRWRTSGDNPEAFPKVK